ncbi:MAG: DoxX family protein [Opitutales bacterium]
MEHVQKKTESPHSLRHGLAWVLQILVALVLGASAVAKLIGSAESIMLFANLGMEPGGRYLIALLELAAALLLLIPFSAPWGAVLAWGVMTGALIAHLSKLGMVGTMLPMTLAAAFNWCASAAILFLRRNQIEFIRCMFDCDRKKDT